jgi:N-acetylglucosaminyldiphosphoundecaprenol N-acetyl-beta-D-mannosaminyltransferase
MTQHQEIGTLVKSDVFETPDAGPAPSVLPTVRVLGVDITDATKQEAVELMAAWVRAADERTRAVFIVNAHTLNLACDDASFRAVLADADVVFGDGTGVRLAARLKGVSLRDNLVGTDLLPAFFRAHLASGYRYFLLGAAPDTVHRAARRLRCAYPGIQIVGHHHGYVGAAETAEVIDMINQASPDMLLVAMGNPIQEQWIDRYRDALRVPVCIGVGGLFDHWAGNLRRAPEWVQAAGIEWVQILLQQPHKWRRYLVGNPKFVVRALRDAWRERNDLQVPALALGDRRREAHDERNDITQRAA